MKKVDQNHSEIVQGLRAAGHSVLSTAPLGKGAPDVIVGGRMPCPHCFKRFPQNVMLEIKDGNKFLSRQKLTLAEEQFHANWRGQIAVITSMDEALRIINAA